jgi:AAA+ ATPase superfamily predicted ATPase
MDQSTSDFFNRARELQQLERAWRSNRPQLITLWGRRRVGKSALLAQFAAGKRAVYVYGTRISEVDMLENLATQMARAFDQPYLANLKLPSWDTAFEIMTRESNSERLLVVFDEFPYLCEVSQGLDTLVQRWWDQIHRSQNIMIVIAGSSFSFMRGLTGASGALHGRRTGQMDVEPFDYYDAAHFMQHLDAVDRVRCYACFGGVPAYLTQIDATHTLAESIQETILTPGTFLNREGEDLLRTEFHNETVYASILRSMASDEERASDIARDIGRGAANEILDHLLRLQDLHMIRRVVPVTELHRPRTQRVVYRLADPYLRFWFRYVSRYQSSLMLGQSRTIWQQVIAPSLDEFVARTAWEDICMQYLQRRVAAGLMPLSFQELGRWWDKDTEIDIVGTWDNRVSVVGECKWTNTPIDMRTYDTLRAKAMKLNLTDQPLWILASRSGFDDRLRARAREDSLLLIEPADLYDASLTLPVTRTGE